MWSLERQEKASAAYHVGSGLASPALLGQGKLISLWAVNYSSPCTQIEKKNPLIQPGKKKKYHGAGGEWKGEQNLLGTTPVPLCSPLADLPPLCSPKQAPASE